MTYIVAINYDTETRMPTILFQTKEVLDNSFELIKTECGAQLYKDDENNTYMVMMSTESLEDARENALFMRNLYNEVS